MKRLSVVERSANCTAPIVNSAIGLPTQLSHEIPTLHAQRRPAADPGLPRYANATLGERY